jgi:hypothetical protein
MCIKKNEKLKEKFNFLVSFFKENLISFARSFNLNINK